MGPTCLLDLQTIGRYHGSLGENYFNANERLSFYVLGKHLMVSGQGETAL